MTSPSLRLLVLGQLAAAAMLSLPVLVFGGFFAAWVPPIGSLAAAFVFFLIRARRPDEQLSRVWIRGVAARTGVVHAVIVGAAYLGAVLSFPDAFSFEPAAAFLLAPVLGAAAGFVVAILTLCAGDAAASSAGGFQEPPTIHRGLPPH